MTDASLTHNVENIYWGSYRHKPGGTARQALQALPRPSAFIAVNNFIAYGALQVFAMEGLAVPKDISLVTFDDFPASINPRPFLTEAVQPAYEMGYQGTQLLLARLQNEGPEDRQEIVLPTKIVIRESTAAPAYAQTIVE
jgi:LacI family transcriptional regulator